MRGQRRWQCGAASDSSAAEPCKDAGAVKTASLAALCSQRQRRCEDSDAGNAMQSATAARRKQ
eukprot:4696934-Pleurochrysis_carterae.AAC.1